MNSKQVVRLLALLLAFCLAALAVTALAAPATRQPSGIKPPERDIKIIPPVLTITAPTGSATWYAGSTQTISWTGHGPQMADLGPVDVTLWKGGQLAVTIAAGSTAGSVSYTIPLTFATGAYELRVTGKNHAGLEARQPLTIAFNTTVTLGPTPPVLVAGTTYNITWTKTGNPGPLDIALNTAASGPSTRWFYIARGVTGNSYSWALPGSWASQQYKLQIQLTDAATGMIYSTSTLFTVSGITFTAPQANEQVATGKPYTIAWTYAADPEAPFTIALADQNGQYTTILTGLHPADRSAKWTSAGAPDIWPTDGATFRLKAYAGQVLLATSPAFTFKPLSLTVGKPHTNTVTSDGIVAAHPYCIPYNSELPPASYKIEIIKVADGTVAETVIAGTTLAQSASGLYCYWTPSATHPAAFYGQNYKVRVTGLAAGGRVAESPPFVIYKSAPGSGSTGTPSSGSTGTPSSGSTGTTTTGTVTVTPPASGGPGTVQLTSDTYYHYNAQDSAEFAKGSTVTLDGSGYVTHGQLAGDQYLKYRAGKSVKLRGYSLPYFSGGYVSKGQLDGDQGLEYAAGKTVYLLSSSVATFTGGYITQGQLNGDQGLEYAAGKKVYLRSSSVADFANGYLTKGQLSGDQSLPYSSGKTVYLRSSSVATFAGGYVTQGQLAYETQLEYASGKKTTFYTVGMTTFRSGGYVKVGTLADETWLTDTSGQDKKVPALSVVTFDDSGRMVSYNPPGFNLNP